MTTAEALDQQHFSKYIGEILNAGALNLGLALGYRSGLFEALDAFDTPQEVGTIAAKARLAPRYVAEWLGIMVSGGIIENPARYRCQVDGRCQNTPDHERFQPGYKTSRPGAAFASFSHRHLPSIHRFLLRDCGALPIAQPANSAQSLI